MTHDDYHVEPIRGLPGVPPEGERILWQGAPDWRALALEAMGLRWVMAYFAALAVWRVAIDLDRDPVTGLQGAALFLVLGIAACAILAGIAWVLAKATVYTITTRRVAMRIGAALTVTLNLPYRWIGAVDLKRGPLGTGDLSLALTGSDRISYFVCWPHVRPWHMRRTQPTLRCIPQPETVARLLAEAAEARLEEQAFEAAGARAPAALAAE
ncbi:photosynthetic complex putative assembly protein PuhB [Albimonas sp. CAU 1670]|uniref:photosynthetic complex putative assembly protein PuhB n=1 Tax=Albimonas sp. CAU 1670 TaxID=3032599 RepID=UPI0023D9FEE1|nr:photosynthetic complex putative assembly protein PuhB [Albimonas sp. CAU 1670]MDF2231506.1 photosynthetic complex putative assembly protein PuhB [Albimonas sp. CAU 1670]